VNCSCLPDDAIVHRRRSLIISLSPQGRELLKSPFTSTIGAAE
jgi:hypothetical protein